MLLGVFSRAEWKQVVIFLSPVPQGLCLTETKLMSALNSHVKYREMLIVEDMKKVIESFKNEVVIGDFCHGGHEVN